LTGLKYLYVDLDLERPRAITEMEETKETNRNQGGAQAARTAKTVHVALIGAAGVGKTSLIHRLGGRPFEPRYFPTETQTYVVEMPETRFIVTEYGGQYDDVYDTNVDAIIVMTTAAAADTRIAFELMRKMPDLPYCFVENKSDIRTNNVNMSCSVKKNENLEAPFLYLDGLFRLDRLGSAQN